MKRSSNRFLEGPGLQPLLRTADFAAWEALVGSSLGHHRSRLLPGSIPFEATIRGGSVDEFQLLLLEGRAQVELRREQCGHGVLWLPLQGWSHELVNGVEHLAEPGMGLLFRPGDVMRGVTSEEIRGLSIVLPRPYLAGAGPASPLLWQGPGARRLIAAGLQLAQAAAAGSAGASHAAEALVDALQACCQPPGSEQRDPITARRRRLLVHEACLWIEAHLAERFSVVEISEALQVSVRSLQYGFQAERGCTPMAEAKRLRLRRLRQLLQDPELRDRSIAELMAAAGLLACGVTAADYRAWCGETPRRTRQLAPR